MLPIIGKLQISVNTFTIIDFFMFFLNNNTNLDFNKRVRVSKIHTCNIRARLVLLISVELKVSIYVKLIGK